MVKPSIRETFIISIIKSIVDGTYKIGDRIPPERDLATSMGISRIIVHAGIVELNAKGLLRIVPRKGTFVNDYKLHGNMDLLSVLLSESTKLDAEIVTSLFDARRLLEVEFASLAALKRTDDNLEKLAELIKHEKEAKNIDEMSKYDFSFHHEIAHATKNSIYPLIIKSMEKTYCSFVQEFYSYLPDWNVVISSHEALYSAIKSHNQLMAVKIMMDILEFGESHISW